MASCEKIADVHRTLQQSASTLHIRSSVVKNNTATHTMPDTTAFSSLFGFQKILHQLNCASQSFLGSLDGKIVLSVNAAYRPPDKPVKKKKRNRETEDEDADRAVAKVEKSGKNADKISAGTFRATRGVLAEMLKIRGANNEPILESWAVSLREQGSWGSTQNPNGLPSVVVGFRFAAGVPIPLGTLCAALRVCRDGLVTTSMDRVNDDFNLPLSQQGNSAEESGQKSILVLASLPHIEQESN